MSDKDAAAPAGETTPDPATDQAPAPQRDEAADLRQRLAGQTAKVNSLADQLKTAKDEAAAAKAAWDEAIRTGKAGEETTRSRLAELEQELNRTKQEVAAAKVAKAYPETYSVFGDAVVNMSPEALAAAEARFTAGATPPTPETPGTLGANPQGRTGAKKVEDMSLEELRKHAATFNLADFTSGA